MTSELNQRLAIKAGWELGWAEMFEGVISAVSETPAGPYANYPATWFDPDGEPFGCPPDYEHSVDAQMCDLDPLLEKKWGGPFDGYHHSANGTCYWRLEQVHSPWKEAEGTGPCLAAARAAAFDQALQEES